jgi:hypothetical protein
MQSTTGQTPIQEVIGNHQYSATMGRLYASALKGWKYCDANPVTSPAPFYLADLVKDVQDRVRKYEKTCFNHKVDLNKKIDVTDPAVLAELLDTRPSDDRVTKKDDEIFCHEQQHNQAMAAAVGELCNIQSVFAQSGELGNAELWFPGQPVTTACKQALTSFVAKSADGSDFKSADGKTVPLGAPMLAWLNQQYKKVNGVVPTGDSENAAIAEHVGACLAQNPNADKIEKKLQDELKEGEDLPTEDPAPATPAPAPAAPTTAGSGSS